MNIVAAVVGSETIILVEGQVQADQTVAIVNDETFNLEAGARHKAYAVMQQRVRDRLKSGVDKVVVKASSGGQFAAKTTVLHAAELRGVLLSSIPDNVELIQRQKKAISRAHSKNLDDYVKDDSFFVKHFIGTLRKGSREAAFLILYEGVIV